jgi:hypothetical protein
LDDDDAKGLYVVIIITIMMREGGTNYEKVDARQ